VREGAVVVGIGVVEGIMVVGGMVVGVGVGVREGGGEVHPAPRTIPSNTQQDRKKTSDFMDTSMMLHYLRIVEKSKSISPITTSLYI
jgi:hypothetical protein